MLKEKIARDLRQSLKERKEIELSVLRMLKAEIVNKEKEKRYRLSKEKLDLSNKELEEKSFLIDKEIVGVVLSKIKKSEKAILEFERGKRDDLVKKEKEEIKILKRYLPVQLSEEEIKTMVKEIIEKIETKDIKDMGKVMSELMPRIKGRAKGSFISKIVKEVLSAGHDRD